MRNEKLDLATESSSLTWYVDQNCLFYDQHVNSIINLLPEEEQVLVATGQHTFLDNNHFHIVYVNKPNYQKGMYTYVEQFYLGNNAR